LCEHSLLIDRDDPHGIGNMLRRTLGEVECGGVWLLQACSL